MEKLLIIQNLDWLFEFASARTNIDKSAYEVMYELETNLVNNEYDNLDIDDVLLLSYNKTDIDGEYIFRLISRNIVNNIEVVTFAHEGSCS